MASDEADAASRGHARTAPDRPTLGQTLPKQRRIGRREGFDFSPGAAVYRNEWFTVRARSNGAGISRLGVAVSKKTAPRAVSRNLAKRLVRDVFRRTFPLHCGLNIIVQVRRQLDGNTAQAGAEALARLFQELQSKCEN